MQYIHYLLTKKEIDVTEQTFIESNDGQWYELSEKWDELKDYPGIQALPLAEPVPQGSIHLVRLAAGTVLPPYTHPCDEHTYVISGTIKTGGRVCQVGTFWSTPAHTRHDSIMAITDSEVISMRLGPSGVVEQLISP